VDTDENGMYRAEILQQFIITEQGKVCTTGRGRVRCVRFRPIGLRLGTDEPVRSLVSL
jgi:hypothetical protein